MDKETARKRAKVMLAYANGKEIEFFNKMTDEWQDANPPYFDSTVEYRVKEIKYRPFKTIKECLTEMLSHSDIGYILYKADGKREPVEIGVRGVYYMYGQGVCSYDIAFGLFTFADGKPFGVREK